MSRGVTARDICGVSVIGKGLIRLNCASAVKDNKVWRFPFKATTLVLRKVQKLPLALKVTKSYGTKNLIPKWKSYFCVITVQQAISYMSTCMYALPEVDLYACSTPKDRFPLLCIGLMRDLMILIMF